MVHKHIKIHTHTLTPNKQKKIHDIAVKTVRSKTGYYDYSKNYPQLHV